MAIDAGPLKPTWRSATFLEYLGFLFALFSLAAFLAVAEREQGVWGLFGWSALALALSVFLATAAEQRGERIAAGLLAFIGVVSWGVFAGSFLEGIGFDVFPGGNAFFNKGLALDTIVLELLVIAAAASALARYRFPLLVVPIVAVTWYAFVDLFEGLFGGGNSATAILAILAGLVLILLGAAFDGGGHHPYAFWLHLLGGLSLGGGILWFWHEHTWEWLLVMLVALLYIALARSLGRSSYAVLGGLGLAGTATYFIERWFDVGPPLPFLAPATEGEAGKWGQPLVYLALGLIFIVIGVFVDRSRPSGPLPAEPAPPVH